MSYCDECADHDCLGHELCGECSGEVCGECGGCDCPENECPGYTAHYTGIA